MLRLEARPRGRTGFVLKTKTPLKRLHGSVRLYGIAAFFILSLSISFFFSSISNGAQVMSRGRTVSAVSSKGKHGASMPQGINMANVSKRTTSSSQTAAQQATSSSVPPKANWVNFGLYTDPNTTAAAYAAANPGYSGASLIARMAQFPVAQWFGDWDANVTADANDYVSAASAAGKVPVLVAYNIPNRDCGGYSIGGAAGVDQYTSWVQSFANGIGNRTAVVILEPDALAALDCLPQSEQSNRLEAIAKAVTILKSHSNTSVYIDSGTPVWQPAQTMASRLSAANVASADGFSINVSYFASTASNRAYGDSLSKLVGNKHYVIDSSRNGADRPVSGMLCNPSFAALGSTPTTNTGSDRNDALLWIKIPWESDGQCNGSPGPGQPYWSYAVQMAQNAGW